MKEFKYSIEDISTGGGCEHILIQYPTFGLCVLINNENQKVPKPGESYDIGVYKLEPEGWMGDYIENCFETFDNFDRKTIVERTMGYLEGKGFEKKPLYNHMYSFTFSLENTSHNGELTTPTEVRLAIEKRLKSISDDELMECMGYPDDTYEVRA